MDTAEELCDKLISWLRLRERCADQLLILAKELDEIQDIVRATKVVANTVAVSGSLAVIGSGLLTLCTAGLGAPALFMAVGGTAAAVTGTAASTIASLVDDLNSSSKMKKANEMMKEDEEYGDEIQNLLDQLKKEVSCTGVHDEDSGVSFRIMEGFARKRNLHLPQNLIKLLIGVNVVGLPIVQQVMFSGLKKSMKGLVSNLALTGLKATAKGMTKVVGGAIGLAFSLTDLVQTSMELAKGDISEAVRGLKDAAYKIREAVREMEENINNIQQVLEEISKVWKAIDKLNYFSNRVDSTGKLIISHAKKYSTNSHLCTWLDDDKNQCVYLNHVVLFKWYFQQLRLETELEKKRRRRKRHVHIVFVAHGSTSPHFLPASCLLPPAIDDVILYSPWNCVINAEVAYGIASGKIQPEDRELRYTELDKYRRVVLSENITPAEALFETNALPSDWNRMKSAYLSIPSIYIQPARSDEKIDEYFMHLMNCGGLAGTDRLIYRYIVPTTVSGADQEKYFPRVPFYVVTDALSLILSTVNFTATVHLAACLRFNGDQGQLTYTDLQHCAMQYACANSQRSYQRIGMGNNNIEASLRNLIHSALDHIFKFPA
ncbi:hypothetical protein AGOR_G00180010 [Albula goreensis]|uniref:Apolipoprotein L3 n=1 Tax=Albula goreensis TaxID=1534307 RepID=A0A8T3CRP0_9TELE|nr:hypothetical protein AGOR_G00180010 [Albula goreensis]